MSNDSGASRVTMEMVMRELAQMRDVIASHKAGGDMATVDTKALAATVSELVTKQIMDAQRQSDLARPVRKGEPIGPEGFAGISAGVITEGRFAGVNGDNLLMANWLLRGAARLDKNFKWEPSKDFALGLQKALTATGVGTGDEYVPTGMLGALWGDMFLSSKVLGTIGIIPMPTDPFDMPLGWGTVTWRKGSANVATTATDPATAKSTLTATEQVAEVNWSYDLNEDAVIAVMPTLRAELARDGAEQMDRFILNADSTDAATGNINLDDSNPPDDSYYLSNGQDGIRHLYIVDNTAQSTDVNAALTDTHMRAGIARLGKYAADVNRLVMVTDPETYVNNMMALTNVVTVDKFGPSATVLTGQLAAYSGIPIVVSAAMAEAEDDGKLSVTPANNDEGQIALFHRDMWRVGFRRELLIELDRNVQKRQLILVVSFRIALAARGTRSSAVHTAGIHGIVRN